MPKKIIFALIFLGFGISMELVLAIHILESPESMKNLASAISSISAKQPALFPTISIDYHHDTQPGPAAESGQGLPEETPAAPDMALTQAGYPAPGEVQPGSDQPEGVEPADSASPAEAAPADDGSGAPPDQNANPPDSGYPPQGQGGGSPPDTYSPPDESGGGHNDYPPVDTGGGEGEPTQDPGSGETPVPEMPTATQAPSPEQPTEALPTEAAPTEVPTEAPAPTEADPPTAAAPTPTPPDNTATPVPPPDNTATAAPPPGNAATTVPAEGLISVPVSTGPTLDGVGSEPFWANAPAVVINVSGGANQSAAQVTIRSVYDGQNIFFLMTWRDPSQSFLLNPWEKQQDGSWNIRIGSDNQGGDENQFYMDKLALLWPVKNSLPDFASRGCAGLCHTGEQPKRNAYGLMYTGGAGQVADLWQWKSVKNVSQVEDDYLDNTQYSKNTPWAGLKGDPGDGGYYTNESQNGKAPAYMPPGGGDKSGAPGFILDAEKAALDENLFKPGDRVPSFIVAPFQGDRGDISAGWRYADGAWTLELGRRLVTGSPYDVQFDDLSKSYDFALAVFDNSQIRHAVQTGATVLKFQR